MRWLSVGVVLTACGDSKAPCEGDAAPTSIATMVDHLNTLPLPIDATCVVQSLQRPLFLEATDNPFSAQPSEGARSPRLFLFSGDLSISLVPTGIGAEVMEFGEERDDRQSVKGELVMPITETLDRLAPHDRIRDLSGGSVCASCHPGEAVVDVPGGTGFASVMFRPDDASLVDIEVLSGLARDCSIDLEPERCGLLQAVFAGDVAHRPFGADLPTIFDMQPE